MQGDGHVQCVLQPLPGDAARAQDGRFSGRKVHDRGLDPNFTAATVKNDVDQITQVFGHMPSLGWTHATESVGGRRGNFTSEPFQKRQSHRMSRHPKSHRLQTPRDQIEHRGMPSQDQRKGPRPESLREQPGGVGHVHAQEGEIFRPRDVNDERVICRPPFHHENARHRFCVRGIHPEPVDRFGRKGDETARVQDAGSLVDVVGRVHPATVSPRPAPW